MVIEYSSKSTDHTDYTSCLVAVCKSFPTVVTELVRELTAALLLTMEGGDTEFDISHGIIIVRKWFYPVELFYSEMFYVQLLRFPCKRDRLFCDVVGDRRWFPCFQ